MMGMPGGEMPPSGDVSPEGEPYIKVTWKQLIKMLQQLNELKTSGTEQPAAQAPAPAPEPKIDAETLAGIDAKLDAIIQGGCQ